IEMTNSFNRIKLENEMSEDDDTENIQNNIDKDNTIESNDKIPKTLSGRILKKIDNFDRKIIISIEHIEKKFGLMKNSTKYDNISLESFNESEIELNDNINSDVQFRDKKRSKIKDISKKIVKKTKLLVNNNSNNFKRIYSLISHKISNPIWDSNSALDSDNCFDEPSKLTTQYHIFDSQEYIALLIRCEGVCDSGKNRDCINGECICKAGYQATSEEEEKGDFACELCSVTCEIAKKLVCERNNKCDCMDGHFKDKDGVCQTCPAQCDDCDNGTECTKCYYGYRVTTDKTCEACSDEHCVMCKDRKDICSKCLKITDTAVTTTCKATPTCTDRSTNTCIGSCTWKNETSTCVDTTSAAFQNMSIIDEEDNIFDSNSEDESDYKYFSDHLSESD
ncbi:hypothetical protein A3Q56_06528, partial [Intoshia linei]